MGNPPPALFIAGPSLTIRARRQTPPQAVRLQLSAVAPLAGENHVVPQVNPRASAGIVAISGVELDIEAGMARIKTMGIGIISSRFVAKNCAIRRLRIARPPNRSTWEAKDFRNRSVTSAWCDTTDGVRDRCAGTGVRLSLMALNTLRSSRRMRCWRAGALDGPGVPVQATRCRYCMPPVFMGKVILTRESKRLVAAECGSLRRQQRAPLQRPTRGNLQRDGVIAVRPRGNRPACR